MEYYATGEKNVPMMKSNKVQNLMWGVLPFLWRAGGGVKGKRQGSEEGVGVSNPKGPDRNEDPLCVQENWTL